MKGFEDLSPTESLIADAGLQNSFNAMLSSDQPQAEVNEWESIFSSIPVLSKTSAAVGVVNVKLQQLHREVSTVAKGFLSSLFDCSSDAWNQYLQPQLILTHHGVKATHHSEAAIQEYRTRYLRSRCDVMISKCAKSYSDLHSSVEVYLRYRLKAHEAVSFSRFTAVAKFTLSQVNRSGSWLIDTVKLPGLG